MEKKAILLVRVSTDRQSYDEQEKELEQMALADGYTLANIVAIAEKESGIKLTENERKGLNRMKEEVERGGVEVVYAWEISRIARKKKVLFSVVDYLMQHRVNLRIKEPNISLMNSDGSINEGAETVLTLFGQLAESEMRNKMVRFGRGKKERAAKGQYNGGGIPYGYTVDSEGYLKADPEKAQHIRDIYSLYLSTDRGITWVAREMQSRGIKVSRSGIAAILRERAYIGGMREEKQRTYTSKGTQHVQKWYSRHFESIISAETYETV